MSGARWIEIEADGSAAAEHFGSAVALFDLGGFALSQAAATTVSIPRDPGLPSIRVTPPIDRARRAFVSALFTVSCSNAIMYYRKVLSVTHRHGNPREG
jgi:hypothetical protein